MKKISTFLSLVLLALIFPFNIFSQQYGCSGQYGGCAPSPSILVNKMVGMPSKTITDPTSVNYVDNLTPSDPRFTAGQIVFFKVSVKNTSNITLNNVILKDNVPSNIEPVTGPGSYNPTNRNITYTIGDINPNEEKVYFMKMQIMTQDKLPADKGLFCLINKAVASNSQISDDDSSQFCVEKQVQGVTSNPSAGPEMGVILLSIDLIAIGTGLIIKRRLA